MILSGVALAVCLIGSNAIWREKVERCQKACLCLEYWFLELHRVIERLTEHIAPLAEKVDNTKFKVEKETIEELVNLLEELPSNDLQDLAADLEKQHELLFGDKRSIGQGTWSKQWIYHLNIAFGAKLNRFYISMNALKAKLNDDSKHKKKMIKSDLLICMRYFVEQPEDQLNDDNQKVHYSIKMLHLSDRPDAPPQGTDYFPTFKDEVEFWCQNVAIFRSSFR